MGETGVGPVEGELVATFLMKPMTVRGVWGTQPNLQMNDTSSGKSYPEKVRSQMNTTDVSAIMVRFFDAVSWRETEGDDE